MLTFTVSTVERPLSYNELEKLQGQTVWMYHPLTKDLRTCCVRKRNADGLTKELLGEYRKDNVINIFGFETFIRGGGQFFLRDPIWSMHNKRPVVGKLKVNADYILAEKKRAVEEHV